jgi:hypothetical protein
MQKINCGPKLMFANLAADFWGQGSRRCAGRVKLILQVKHMHCMVGGLYKGVVVVILRGKDQDKVQHCA